MKDYLTLVEMIELFNQAGEKRTGASIYCMYGEGEGSFCKLVKDKGLDYQKVIKEVIKTFGYSHFENADYCVVYSDGKMELYSDWGIFPFLMEKGFTQCGYFDPDEEIAVVSFNS